MWFIVLWLALVACKDKERAADPTPAAAPKPAVDPPPGAAPSPADPPPAEAPKPADPPPANDMDEKMRHCPLAIAGVTASVADAERGVQFEIRGGEPVVAEIRRRAHHVVEFAAGRAQAGTHGGGSGGGTMRNCPVVTSGVEIVAADIDGGARLVVKAVGGDVAALRRETQMRTKKFAFDGVTLERR